MPKTLILQIETATQVCSVALSANGDTVAFRDLDQPNAHASQLTLLIAEVLHEVGVSFSDLSAVAVSKGPGSYTGLRIGVSTAKGLCYATGLPLIAVGTLKMMAEGFKAIYAHLTGQDILLSPMVDARRMEVYLAIYNHQEHLLRSDAAVVIDAHSFDDLAKDQKIMLFGNGADKFEDLFAGHEQITVVPGFQNSARYLSRVAFETFIKGVFEDVAYFEPYYLKDFVTTTPKRKPL